MKRLVLVGLAAIGCGDVKGNTIDARQADSNARDTLLVDSPPAPRCDPTKPFGSPTVLANVNTTSDEVNPFVTADELQLWFSSNRRAARALTSTWRRARRRRPTSALRRSSPASTPANADTRPTLTADGLTIYIQYLASPNGFYEITSATRASTSVGFGAPTSVAELTKLRARRRAVCAAR